MTKPTRHIDTARLDYVTWEALYDVARRKGCSPDILLEEIIRASKGRRLSAEVMNYAVQYYRIEVLAGWMEKRWKDRETDRWRDDDELNDPIFTSICSCVERHANIIPTGLARIILGELSAAGYEVVSQFGFLPSEFDEYYETRSQ
jgi:hypothetical protein